MSFLFDQIWGLTVAVLVRILPASSGLPTNFQESLTSFIAYLNLFNLILPIDTMLQIVAVSVIFELGIVTWHFIKMVLNYLRGSGA